VELLQDVLHYHQHVQQDKVQTIVNNRDQLLVFGIQVLVFQSLVQLQQQQEQQEFFYQ
jgi:hypothetical protein